MELTRPYRLLLLISLILDPVMFKEDKADDGSDRE